MHHFMPLHLLFHEVFDAWNSKKKTRRTLRWKTYKKISRVHYLLFRGLNQSGCEPLNLENKLWKGVLRHCSYIHYIQTLLNLPSDFRVAYAANISGHLTIWREKDHHTGKYVNYSFRTLRKYLGCEGRQSSFRISPTFSICKMKQFNAKKPFVT